MKNQNFIDSPDNQNSRTQNSQAFAHARTPHSESRNQPKSSTLTTENTNNKNKRPQFFVHILGLRCMWSSAYDSLK